MEAANRFEKVRAAIEQIGPADHVCTLYDQRGEEVAIAVAYIRAGLDRGERAELAGGRVDIESAPGAGTTLRARFPLR